MVCIAIGNRMMADDSIGIQVLEALAPQLRQKNIEIVFGETDTDYALSQINNGDYLYILDSTYFGIAPGTVTVTPIQESMVPSQTVYSQHQPSLINLLKIYKQDVAGIVIGIEVMQVAFSLELSDVLKNRFTQICEEVSEFIQDHIRSGYSA